VGVLSPKHPGIVTALRVLSLPSDSSSPRSELFYSILLYLMHIASRSGLSRFVSSFTFNAIRCTSVTLFPPA